MGDLDLSVSRKTQLSFQTELTKLSSENSRTILPASVHSSRNIEASSICVQRVSLPFQIFDTEMSGASGSPYLKSITDTYAQRNQLFALPTEVKLLADTLTEVGNAYSEDAAIEILNIFRHPGLSLEILNSNITSLKQCQEFTAFTAEAYTGPPRHGQ